MKQKILIPAVFVFLLSACGQNSIRPDSDGSIKLIKILDQVNDAIAAAKEINNDKAPQIQSVQLDLQLETANSVDGSFPISLVTPQIELDHERTHKISLTFTPIPKKVALPAEQSQLSELTATISAINQAVIQAEPSYQFQKGSIQIQCTFKNDVGADAEIGKLVPIKIGGTHSGQTIQTITLNFAPQVTTAKK